MPGALGESLQVLVLLSVLEAMFNLHLDTLELVTTQHLVLAPLVSAELKPTSWGEATGLQDVSAKVPAGQQQMVMTEEASQWEQTVG